MHCGVTLRVDLSRNQIGFSYYPNRFTPESNRFDSDSTNLISNRCSKGPCGPQSHKGGGYAPKAGSSSRIELKIDHWTYGKFSVAYNKPNARKTLTNSLTQDLGHLRIWNDNYGENIFERSRLITICYQHKNECPADVAAKWFSTSTSTTALSQIRTLNTADIIESFFPGSTTTRGGKAP